MSTREVTKPIQRTPAVETPEVEARRKLFDFLFKESKDKKLALRCAGDIHAAVCMFGITCGCADSAALAPGKATRPLQRLQRTVKTDDTKWANAWSSLTRAAWDCLAFGNPGKAVPLTSGVPRTAEVAPLIPGALAFAQSRGKRLKMRDTAVITILIAFRRVYGSSPTEKTARWFVEAIEKLYVALISEKGFNLSSTGTFQKLIDESKKRTH